MNNHLSVFLKHRFLRRALILLVYLGILGSFLYISKIRDRFFPDTTLRIYTYVDNFSPECVREFEQQFGIKVSVRYFDSNEELLAKFKISRGKGYDLITPSDYMVELLRREGLLQELDHHQLPVLEELDPRLLDRYFDPGNRFSLPLMWIPYGIVFHKGVFVNQPEEMSLSVLFDDPEKEGSNIDHPYRICMVDDPREAIFLASLYLFGDVNSFSTDRLATVRRLLIKQKRWVESYINQDLRYYLLSGLVEVAFAPAVFARKIVEQSEEFGFMIPKEGANISIENVAIPRASGNAAAAHKFINFILSKQVALDNSANFGFNPTNAAAYEALPPEVTGNPHLFPAGASFERLTLMHNDIPLKHFEEIWLAVKSA